MGDQGLTWRLVTPHLVVSSSPLGAAAWSDPAALSVRPKPVMAPAETSPSVTATTTPITAAVAHRDLHDSPRGASP
jgi:hypothetical protein